MEGAMAFELNEIFYFSLSWCLICALIAFKLTRKRSKYNLPPSPPKLPIIGNLHQLGALPHRSFRALSHEYGHLMLLHLGQTPTLVVSSADLAREINKNNDVAFSDRPSTTAAKILFYGCKDVGFAPYGEEWRQKRKVSVVELLSSKRVRSFQFIREEEVSELVDKIREACTKNDGSSVSVNLTQMLVASSNNVVSRSIFGHKYETLDGETESSSFGEIGRKVMHLFGEFSFGNFFPSLGWLDVVTGLIPRMKATFKELDAFMDQVIAQHRSVKRKDEKDFVDILLQLQQDGTPDFDLSLDSIKAILVETLRLHPPGPLLVPRETSDSVKLGGYDIPTKTTVLVNAWAIQRDPDLWERPEEFVPERFENSKVDFKGQDFQFIPFGFGRRRCPGLSFGVASVEYTLANLLYWFDWKLHAGTATSAEGIDMSET